MAHLLGKQELVSVAELGEKDAEIASFQKDAC